MGQTSKFITIIRPEFMEFCGDACRAAALNHLFYRIAGKCKDQPKEKIQAGQILWYGSNELITEEMSNAWGVCKVRKEVNELIGMNLFGKTSNPDWGADRTKHFFFGTEQCAKFLELCEEHTICFVHLDLPDEVKHLIYSSNANDKSIKCICEKPQIEDANDKSIECNSYIYHLQTINPSFANDKSIEAITKNTTKINNIEDYEERESTAPESHTPTVSPPVVGDARALSPQSDIDEAMIREVISESGETVTEELIQRTLAAIKQGIIVQRRYIREQIGLPSETQSQQGDAQVDILPGSVDRAGTLPSAALGDLPPSSQDRPVATPTTRPVLEATEEIAVSKKGRDDGQRIANTPTPTPAQAPPPTSEQAAPGQAKGKGKKQAEVKTETPKGPPAEPPSEMAWGTRKCLLWFDYWRGGILIGKWKLMQASTCAKGLAEQFSEEQVIETRTMMEADPYYIDKGGCDVCDVANNIHRYLKRKQQTKKPAQATNVAQSQPITNIRELVKQREALRAATAVQVGV